MRATTHHANISEVFGFSRPAKNSVAFVFAVLFAFVIVLFVLLSGP